MKKIVVIHTTPVTIPTLKELIEKELGDCEVVNLLDDSMLPEINAAGRMTEAVRYRLYSLLTLAGTMKPDAVLCACSSIGGLIDDGRCLLPVPVLRIDEPMAEKAVQAGSRIGVAATLQSTLGPTCELIERKAKEAGKTVTISSRVIEGAGALLSAGDGAGYDALVSGELRKLAKENDVVVLAQASMARAAAGMTGEEKEKLLTSPESGVKALAKRLENV